MKIPKFKIKEEHCINFISIRGVLINEETIQYTKNYYEKRINYNILIIKPIKCTKKIIIRYKI